MFGSLTHRLSHRTGQKQLLLLFALLVALMQTVAVARSLPHTSQGVPTQVCTALGMVTLLVPGEPAQQGPGAGSHDCCVACVLGGPLLQPDVSRAVSPGLSFAAPLLFAQSVTAERFSYRLPPSRAPPRF